MGQVLRMMKYDQADNLAKAFPSPFTLNNTKLLFSRLDDGVMGGKSITNMDQAQAAAAGAALLFAGTINTDGGGFASIRSPLENSLPKDAKGLKLKYKGDGKTYKVLLSKKGAGGPFAKDPSWQADLATTKSSDDDAISEAILPYESFVPSFGGGGKSRHDMSSFVFHQEEMGQMGLMLSLKLSCGKSNPVETYGEGIFDFKLEIHEIDFV